MASDHAGEVELSFGRIGAPYRCRCRADLTTLATRLSGGRKGVRESMGD